MTWFCVVDGQGFVHSVWGKALEREAIQRADDMHRRFGWAGVRVIKVTGEKPSVGFRLPKGVL